MYISSIYVAGVLIHLFLLMSFILYILWKSMNLEYNSVYQQSGQLKDSNSPYKINNKIKIPLKIDLDRYNSV